MPRDKGQGAQMVHVFWLSREVRHGQKSTSQWLDTQIHKINIFHSKSRYADHVVRKAIESSSI